MLAYSLSPAEQKEISCKFTYIFCDNGGWFCLKQCKLTYILHSTLKFGSHVSIQNKRPLLQNKTTSVESLRMTGQKFRAQKTRLGQFLFPRDHHSQLCLNFSKVHIIKIPKKYFCLPLAVQWLLALCKTDCQEPKDHTFWKWNGMEWNS